MGERALASVRIVTEIKPIEGADFIEVARVDGWECIVKKGEIKVNDKVVYFEVDSFLPELEQLAFLAKSSAKFMDGVAGYRLKTMRMKKTLSQGLILPLSDFNLSDKLAVGTDLTDKLGVRLYEPTREVFSMERKPKGLKGLFYKLRNKVVKVLPKTKGFFDFIDKVVFRTVQLRRFPSYIQKTDQERIQNLSGKLDQLSELTYEVTIKLDGSSMTDFRRGKEFGVCSRNIDVTGQENNYTNIDETYNISKTLQQYSTNVAIQGEMIGEGIQGNNEGIKGIDFYVFDIYNIDEHRYLTRCERIQTLAELKSLGCDLKHVPILHTGFSIKGMTMEDILKMAEGESLFAKNREGLVFKSEGLMNGRTVSFKAISNKYLLKQED